MSEPLTRQQSLPRKNYCSQQRHILSFSNLHFSIKESLSEETFSEEEEQAQEHAEQEEFFIAEHEQQLAGTPDFLACFRFFIIKQTTNAAQTIIKESKTIFKIMQTSKQPADFILKVASLQKSGDFIFYFLFASICEYGFFLKSPNRIAARKTNPNTVPAPNCP